MWNKAQGDSQDHSAGRVALAWSDLPDRPCFVSDPPLPLTPASFGLFSLYRHPWMVLSAAVPNAALSSFLVFFFFFKCGPFSKYCFCVSYFGHEACGILAPQPGIESKPATLEGLNHWTVREVPLPYHPNGEAASHS